MRHLHFLVERKLDRGLGRLEIGLRRVDRRNHHPPAGVHHIFDEAHGVLFLLLRLREKMLGQLRQRVRREMRRDRVILHGRAEFVSDLFVDGVDDFVAGQHKNLSC